MRAARHLLSARDGARATVRVVWVRARAPSWLARASLPALLERIAGRAPRRTATLTDVARGIRVGEAAVRRASLPDTCLFRALGRYAALRRAGLDARFVLGMRPGEVRPEGHAWIELDGAPFDETLDPALVRTWTHPSPA